MRQEMRGGVLGRHLHRGACRTMPQPVSIRGLIHSRFLLAAALLGPQSGFESQ